MNQPEELKKDEPLLWSAGTGVEVWQLFCAVIGGDLDAVKKLLHKNPALIRCHYAYRTPFYFAVRENQLEITAFLLDQAKDPTALAVNDRLVDIARDRGYGEMLKLLESRLDRDHGISNEGEPLAEAIRQRNLPKVRELLDASPGLLQARDAHSNQPIHWAVMTRQIDILDELLARGADINAQRANGARPVQLTNGDYHYRGWRDVPKDVTTTPSEVLNHLLERGAYCDICTAASIGDVDRVRSLLDEDPSLVNRLSDYVTYYIGSGSPLRNAAARGHIEVVKLLLERGADPNLPEEGIAPKGCALYSAVYYGHHEIAKLLLDRGAYPSPPVESSADALSIAMMNDDQKMVDLLCSYGSSRSVDLLAHYGDLKTAAAVFAANPALADNPGAFRSAIGNGHDGFVQLMLRYQPDLVARVSVASKKRALTEHLFKRGMNPGRPDWLGVTQLHEFARKNEVENAALFLNHGADIHARDEDICSTPLAWAAKYGKILMVELLLRRGAKTTLPDDPPWATPIAWATRYGHAVVIEILQRWERDGTLPSRSLAQFESLAIDLLAACGAGDPNAIKRLQDYFQPDRRITQEQLNRHVRDRLEMPQAGENAQELSPGDARLFIARFHGVENWEELVKQAAD